MPLRTEVQRRAEYLERAVEEGVAPLWALIGVTITVVGGSLTLGLIWGVKHLIWTLVIALLVLLAVLAEGSYRVATHRETKYAERVAELEQERDTARTELEAATRQLAPSAMTELAARAQELSRELYEFLGDRRQDNPILDWPPSSRAQSEDEAHQRFVEHGRRSRAFDTKTMSRFDLQFSARVLAVFDAAAEAGLADKGGRPEFEHPTNEGGIRIMAQQLGTIAARAAEGR